MAEEAGPEYRRLMYRIRSRIVNGDYPVGTPIPSTARLVVEEGMSQPVVRRAVDQLKADGILQGHPGKGVYVRALPATADSNRVSVEQLGTQLASLREDTARLTEQAAGCDALRAECDELRDRVGRLETAVMDLFGRLGFDFPDWGGRDKRAGRGGRAAR